MELSIFCELFWYDINRKKGYSSLREKMLGWGGEDQRFDNRRDGLKYLLLTSEVQLRPEDFSKRC